MGEPSITQPHILNTVSTTTNPMPSILHTRQPRRPLKRGLQDLEGDQQEEICTKRQRLYAFLEDLPEPLTRCRSDSYLASNMSTRPDEMKRNAIPVDERALLATPNAYSEHTHTSTPLDFGMTDSGPTLYTDRHAAFRNPSFRKDLLMNGIRIVGSREASRDMVEYAQSIIGRARNSPGLSEEQAEAAAVELEGLRHSGDEFSLGKALVEHRIIPQYRDLGPNIISGGNRIFNRKAVPHIQDSPTLPAPRPDQYFAYRMSTFSHQQMIAMDDSALHAYSEPVAISYFPFFTIELKATARTGSIWVAENQAATSGAFCVNSMERLFNAVKRHPKQIETIAFSCLMDERSATIWLTYYDQVNRQLINVEIEHYYMAKTSDIIGVQNAIRNICEWGLKVRLPVLISVLDQYRPQYLDKDLRTRRSSLLPNQPAPKRQKRELEDLV